MRPSFFVVVLSDNGKSRQPKAVFRQGYPLSRQDWLTWCFMVDKMRAHRKLVQNQLRFFSLRECYPTINQKV